VLDGDLDPFIRIYLLGRSASAAGSALNAAPQRKDSG
jgi:hypothetical protein